MAEEMEIREVTETLELETLELKTGSPQLEAPAALRFPLSFELWTEELRRSAGSQYVWALNRISPHILEIFYREGCAPSLEAVILHCESGPRGRDAAPQ
jgi:hypothetical protein